MLKLCIALFFSFYSLNVVALDNVKPIECNTPLKLSITNEWYPYVRYSQYEEPSGVDVELLKRVLLEMDCDLIALQFPERRSLFELSMGNFDIALGASKNPEREADFHFSKNSVLSVTALLIDKTIAVYKASIPLKRLSKTVNS